MTAHWEGPLGGAEEQVYHHDEKYALRKRGTCIIEQDSYADRREPPYSQWPLAAEVTWSQKLAALPTQILKTVFFPLSHIAELLSALSAGVKVTGVKAVAGPASHVSRAHSQWLFHACFSS